MSLGAKVLNGALRYRATQALDVLKTPPGSFITSDDGTPNLRSRLRQHPYFLNLPAITLPAQLDMAAINYLREHSSSSPQSIEDRAARLSAYLWSRPLIFERHFVDGSLQSSERRQDTDPVDGQDRDLSDALKFHNTDITAYIRPAARKKIRQDLMEEWTSLSYSGANCELYLTARLVPNFTSVCRILYEIRKRCPRFIPRNLFDFGSGLGTVTWAANTVWPVGCIKEHYMVEPSADMTKLSEFMFRKNFAIQSPETIFPGIFHRRFLPVTSQPYDLVVSAHSLMELAGAQERIRILANLWTRTTDFLVLIEQGTKAGFAAILEARDWLIKNGGEEVFIFAPCPHKLSCGKENSLCNIAVRYYYFELTRSKNEPLTELVSYLVVSRGDWRRHQNPVVPDDPSFLPRIVSQHVHLENRAVTHDICLPTGEVERAIFSKSRTDKSFYYFLRNAKGGDLIPCEPSSCPNETTGASEISGV